MFILKGFMTILRRRISDDGETIVAIPFLGSSKQPIQTGGNHLQLM
jgi:hypothetical protein